jgi:hypothetical protein
MSEEVTDENIEEPSTEEEPEESAPEGVESEEESTEEGTEVEPSEESEKEPEITLEKTHALAEALQKGYTMSRQDLADIKRNQEAIQEALDILRSKKDDSPKFDEDDQLTVGQYMELERQKEQKRAVIETEAKKEEQKRLDFVDKQISDLKIDGVIKSKEDEDELVQFAVDYAKKHPEFNVQHPNYLRGAAEIWQKEKAFQKAGAVAKAKNEVKKEAGSKIGTSQKNKAEDEQGISYEDIHTKSMDELTS